MKTKQPRRAGMRWRESAPEYVVDCLHDPRSSDEYTVIVLPATEDGFVSYLSLTSTGSAYWGDLTLSECAAYRYRCKHQRVRWLDLPRPVAEAVRSAVANGDSFLKQEAA